MATSLDGILTTLDQLSYNKTDRTNTSEAPSRTPGGDLGKDEFLQLLVCQMKNQDPLEPNKDTDFIAQLAQFSALEQMQNLNATYEKSQAFSLIGKDVIVNTEDSTGKETQVAGKVQYVNASGSTVQIYVNGKLYDIDDLYAVMDEGYVKSICSPTIDKEYKFTYDAEKPSGGIVEVNLGEDEYAADEVALVINKKLIDPSKFKLDGNKLTIFASAFEDLPNGSYSVAVVFNDNDYTTVEDKISVQVVNSKVTVEEDKKPDDSTQEPEGDEKNQTEGSGANQTDKTE